MLNFRLPSENKVGLVIIYITGFYKQIRGKQ